MQLHECATVNHIIFLTVYQDSLDRCKTTPKMTVLLSQIISTACVTHLTSKIAPFWL